MIDVPNVPVVRFLVSVYQAVVYAVIVFAAIPLAFSDPLRDPSFRSKATVSGVLIFANNILAAMALTDVSRYYHLWPHKAAQIALQVRCPRPVRYVVRAGVMWNAGDVLCCAPPLSTGVPL